MRSSAKVLLDLEECVRAIASAAPFAGWPKEQLRRLAQASRVVRYHRGDVIQAQGSTLDAIALVVAGSIQASAQNADGRRYTFALVRGAAAYGLLPLIDGREMPNDTIAIGPVTALLIPFDVIRDTLAREPALWSSVALEVSLRARANAREWTRLALEPLRIRAAALLVSLAEASGLPAEGGPVTIGVHMPQERLGEMLGVSRQTATALVRDLADAGLIRWNYGRVSVLNLPALRETAGNWVDRKA
jgi:CRP-like cAMP-binding protein